MPIVVSLRTVLFFLSHSVFNTGKTGFLFRLDLSERELEISDLEIKLEKVSASIFLLFD